jgi:hypothetical protein
MKAISIKQPWADAILLGLKRVENRTWGTHHEGPLILHAGKGFDKAGYEWLRMVQDENAEPHWSKMPLPENYRRGAFLGVIEIIDCKKPGDMSRRDNGWRDINQYGWGIGRTLRFMQPIEGNGALRLFRPPPMIAGYAKMQWNNNPIPAAAR